MAGGARRTNRIPTVAAYEANVKFKLKGVKS